MPADLRWLPACLLLLAGCAGHTPMPGVPGTPWERRMLDLQRTPSWSLDGRAGVALGSQGWQASLQWQESESQADLHLAGPLGIGAMEIKSGPDGIALNGAPPSDTMTQQLTEKLGFELPLLSLRYWLLGVPDPAVAFDLTRNEQQRAAHLSQGEWSIDYDRYLPVNGDVLPGRLVLSRGDVRVRIFIDHWKLP
jgi:outer membrane lipoprotein LolB